MSDIVYLQGDATAPQTDGSKIIAHVCNDIGGWGRGFVMAVSRRWPDPEREYRNWYAGRADNDFGLGSVQLVHVEPETWVANMIGQHGVGVQDGQPPIRYEALEQCLASLAEQAAKLQASVHMPRIGCGLAGGDWQEVEPIIQRTLCQKHVPVYVYDFAS